tara:strand:- start:74 stop:595 length:522 start_codon:yes stop_codon:yes gene_type:complete
MTHIAFNDIPLNQSLTQRRSQRVQRAQFGDGYSQVLTDGVNAEQETWECQTPPLTFAKINSLESFFLEQKGQAIAWTPPYSTKTFSKPFTSGTLSLGYTNLGALTLTGYTRPVNYTANLVTGVLTSVDVPNDQNIPISLTLAARNYLLADGWQISTIDSAYAVLSFSLVRVYV